MIAHFTINIWLLKLWILASSLLVLVASVILIPYAIDQFKEWWLS